VCGVYQIYLLISLFEERRYYAIEHEIQNFFKDFTYSVQKMSLSSPQMVKGFGSLHDQVMKSGVLGEKEKELIALGIAVAVHCIPCIRLHTRAAHGAGATKEEIMEAASVAVVMAGGPAYTHVPEVVNTLETIGG
jgi:AhpD family alkylhydroperoxidase